MFKRLWTVTLLFTAFICAGAPVSVSVDPDPVVTGETAMFTLSWSQNEAVSNIEFPTVAGIQWQTNIQSSGSSFVNGQLTVSRSYGMLIAKDGDYVIPAVTLRTASGKALQSDPVTLRSRPRDYGFRRPDGTKAEISELIFMRAEFPKERTRAFAGEFFPVTVRYYFRSDLPVSVTNYPSFADNPLFAVNRITDPQTGEVRDFNLRGQSKVIENRQEFNVMIFDALIRPLKPGRLGSGAVNGVMNLRERAQNRDPFASFFADDFFGSPMRAVKVSAALPDLSVQAVPPPPPGTVDLGLIGNYQLTLNLSDSPYREGDPVTLDVLIDGFGAENAKADKLNLPGFRTFPPEVSKVKGNSGNDAARLRYVLVPMQSGAVDLNLAFSFFNPLSAAHAVEKLDCKLEILANAYASAPSAVQPSTLPEADQRKPQVRKVHSVSDILYLKECDVGVRSPTLPLWRNGLSGKILMVAAALLFFFGCEVYRQTADARGDDPAYDRKRSASSRRKSLLHRLEAASPETFETLCRTEFSDWLSDTAGLPAGSGLSELAARAKSPELAGALRDLESAGYRPGGLADKLEPCRKAVCAALKKGTWLFALIFAVSAFAADPNVEAYDNGDFKTALDGFEKAIAAPGGLQSGLFFNAGNALYQLRDYPRALLRYEQARRLAPGDADILSNLNAVCRKLEVPERAVVVTPLDFGAVLRDALRADAWITFGCAMLALTLVLAGLKRLRVNLPLTAVWIAAALGGAAFGFAFWQEKTLYDPSEALVVKARLEVFNLPLAQSAKQLFTLPAGFSVQIREQRTHWTLIRCEAGEGWVESGALALIWPPAKK